MYNQLQFGVLKNTHIINGIPKNGQAITSHLLYRSSSQGGIVSLRNQSNGNNIINSILERIESEANGIFFASSLY